MLRKAVLALLLASTCGQAFGQSLITSAPIGDFCVELNQTAMTQIANGKLKEAELVLAPLLSSGGDQARRTCAGFVLKNKIGRAP